ncbi:MAG: ATP-binding protein [Bacteroidia bacterium]|nr:ATP-binding protein [Bacteroidia bacterium]
MKVHAREFLWFLVLFLPLLGLWYAVDAMYVHGVRRQLASDVKDRLSDRATVLSAAVNSKISFLYGIKSFVEADPSVSRLDREFERIARSIVGRATCIRAVQIVQDGRITYSWPVTRNQNVLGHNLLTDAREPVRRTVAEAMRTDRVVLNGPIELLQGGLGMVGRLRLLGPDGNVWGLAAIVIDIPDLLVEAGISPEDAVNRYALRSGDASVFFGSPTLPAEEAERERVMLIGGEWTYYAAPLAGWDAVVQQKMRDVRVYSGVIALLLAVLLLLFVRNREILKNLVEHRTSELRKANEDLQNEVEHRTRISEELTVALARAEESDRMKDAFIASISHEIRTPLHIILGYVALVHADAQTTPDERAEYLHNIHQASGRLMRTVEHLLQLSSLRTGAFRPNIEAMDLVPLIGSLVSEYRTLAEKKTLQLEFTAPDEAVVARVDRFCVEQSLANVLDNAIKYTKAGFIRVRTEHRGGVARIVVQDSGIGISQEYRSHVFEPFSQEVGGYARPYEGLGLGLALTSRYIEMCGGSIEIQSSKGEGTEVTILLAAVDEEAMPAVALPKVL